MSTPTDASQETLARLLAAALAAPDRPTRAALADLTGVSRPTVTRLVETLLAAGLLREEGAASTGGGRGRPGVALAPTPGRHVALGLQVGVAGLAVHAVDLRGDLLAARHEPRDLAGADPTDTLAALADLAEQVRGRLPTEAVVVGVGVALPGLVDTGSGMLRRAPNLGWADLDVPALLPDLPEKPGLPGPLLVGNEADLAALAVARAAPGRPGDLGGDFLYLSGEVGIGAALVRDGAVVAGRHGWAGEIGHTCVDPHGRVCEGCGSTGCLEAYAGRRALRTGAGLDPHGSVEEVVALAAAGEGPARDAVARATGALAVAVANAVQLLDVPTVVLGGDLAALTPAALDPVALEPLEQAVVARVVSSRWAVPQVLRGPQDPWLAATGAAVAALERMVAAPGPYLC